jgi:type IV pilus assembly protein PilQ
MRHNWTLRRRTVREGAHPTTGRGPGAWAGLAVALAASMVIAAFAAVEPSPPPPRARLATVSAKASVRGASVLIEASEPVAYITTRPDPLTVLVDLRNVSTAGASNRIATSPVGPVAAVTFEDARAADGAAVARVRVLLAAPAQHQVHSERNLIQVDVLQDEDAPSAVKLAGSSAPASPTIKMGASAPKPSPNAATRLEAVRTNAGPRGIEVTLAGNGALVATASEMTRSAPHKLVLDFAGVSPAVPPTVQVGKGAVERVRVASFSVKPQVTRVVFDLARPVSYTLQPSGSELKVAFNDGAAAAPPSASAVSAASTLKVAEPPKKDARPAEAPAAAGPVATPPAASVPTPQAPPAAQAPARPPVASINQVPQQAATARSYSGHPVSLDFQGADLRSVLRTFSEISGLNLVIDPAVQGTVDVTLRDVPWDQALDNILRSNKLGYVVDGTIVRVAPLTVLAAEEESMRKLSEAQALSGELKVMTKTLNYAMAVDLEPMLKGNALSNRGTTAVDRRTNTIVINDLPPYLAKAEALINALDQAEGQVEIEARIVSTSKTFARELGIKWGFLGQMAPELGNTTGAAFPNTVRAGGVVNQAITTSPAPNKLTLALGSVNGSFNLDAELTALEKDGRIKVLLQPRVVTQNNVKARIARGQEIPYTTTVAPPSTGGSGQTVIQPMPTVQFKTAALTLEVTPRITPADTILLDVDVDNGSPGEPQPNGNLAINTQRAQTKVLVQNGATTVIGGIYSSQENRVDSRTPGLGKIPLLGWLFKSESIKDTNEELLIFITPRVIRLK